MVSSRIAVTSNQPLAEELIRALASAYREKQIVTSRMPLTLDKGVALHIENGLGIITVEMTGGDEEFSKEARAFARGFLAHANHLGR